MTRIFVVEDHPIMSQALCTTLGHQQDMDVCGVAATGEAALEAVAAAAPDLVLVDVSLPGMNGLELVARLCARDPALRCVMLSRHRQPRHAEKALAAGAWGYVLKGSMDKLIDGIRRVMRGETHLSSAVSPP